MRYCYELRLTDDHDGKILWKIGTEDLDDDVVRKDKTSWKTVYHMMTRKHQQKKKKNRNAWKVKMSMSTKCFLAIAVMLNFLKFRTFFYMSFQNG